MASALDVLFWRKTDAPCLTCEDRYLGCHGKCKAYLDWNRGQSESRESIHMVKLDECMKDEVERSGIRKRRRFKR